MKNISSCLDNHIDAQIVFLEWHIEQLQSTSTQLHQLQDSNDHMMVLYHELSRTFHIQDQKRLFNMLREVKSSKVSNSMTILMKVFKCKQNLMASSSITLIT